MTPLEQISPAARGERLRIAREAANVTQATAATAIGVARTTVVAIEQGERRVRMDELQKLAKLYGTSVNALFRQEAIHVDLAPRFRKLDGNHGGATMEAAELLAGLAKAEVELENLLGVNRPRNDPPERPILKGDVRAQAEQDAAELRQHLGLGNRIVVDVVPGELETGRGRGRQAFDRLNELAAAGVVGIVPLDEAAAPYVEELVVGAAAATLDDGEAATIAYALVHAGTALIDERKATRMCAQRYPQLRVACTVDVLTHPDVGRQLGPEELAEAVFKALHAGASPRGQSSLRLGAHGC